MVELYYLLCSWVPIDTGLLSVPEMSQYLAEAFVTVRLYMRALRNLRKSRRHAVRTVRYTTYVMLTLTLKSI